MSMASSCRGYSKAQTCFFKILHTISSTPPSEQQPQPFPANAKGIGIDLNLRISSAAEESESSRSDGSSATARAVTTTNNNNEEEEALPEKVDNEDEVDNHVETESEGEGNENAEAASFREGGGDSNCLDLLIEAARVISEKDESDSEGGESRTRRASREKRKERWVVVDLYADVAEEREPVVRSKRGRNQALPYRFRDSVVEPLKRATRSQRPSSTSHLSKRLLRLSPTT